MEGCCKVKRGREGVAKSAVIRRRVAGQREVRETRDVDNRRLGRRRARSEWRLESPELLEFLLDRTRDARGAVKLTWCGKVAFEAGSEGDSVGTVRSCAVRH